MAEALNFFFRLALGLIGVALLFPGACSLLATPFLPKAPEAVALWLAGIVAGTVGVALLAWLWKTARSD